jgi:catechol 2,3-dioxygenase-like lactoylglutathione lyase family enzyme
MAIPSGTESARPFLPTKDFDASKAFYEALGFQKLLDGDVAIFAAGQTSFILQHLYDEKWAGYTMMQLMVDDLDKWWVHIESLDLPKRFGVPPPKPPTMMPWGLRIVYVVDPSGILWHIAQRTENTVERRDARGIRSTHKD